MQFHETPMGSEFYSYYIPKLVKSLEKITEKGKEEKEVFVCFEVSSKDLPRLGDGVSIRNTVNSIEGVLEELNDVMKDNSDYKVIDSDSNKTLAKIIAFGTNRDSTLRLKFYRDGDKDSKHNFDFVVKRMQVK